MIRYLTALLLTLSVSLGLNGQSFWFGVKGGVAMANQSWGSGGNTLGVNRNPIFPLNGDFFVESLDEDKKGALYAQLGYHGRGSSVRFFSSFGQFNPLVKYKFHNAVLELGAKKSFDLLEQFGSYFILGVRGEYTFGSNLSVQTANLGQIVSPEYIRHFNYGVTFGGGFEKILTEMSNAFIEFSIQPDLSFQYEQFPIDNVRNPWVPNERIDLPLTQVRNLTIEAKIGIKFLRKVIYID